MGKNIRLENRARWSGRGGNRLLPQAAPVQAAPVPQMLSRLKDSHGRPAASLLVKQTDPD